MRLWCGKSEDDGIEILSSGDSQTKIMFIALQDHEKHSLDAPLFDCSVS